MSLHKPALYSPNGKSKYISIFKPMKRFPTYIWLWFIWLVISACVSGPVSEYPSVSQPADPTDVLFQQGEQFLAHGDSESALSRYSRYLSQYPQGRMASVALSRIGDIYVQQELYDAAQAFYQRLMAEFPESASADKARLAIIDLLILDNQPGAAIAQAEEMLRSDLDMALQHDLWQRLARQYDGSGSTIDAAAYAYLLYSSGPEEERLQWAEQLKVVIERLDVPGIEALWDRIDDDYARSLLLYRYAVLQVVMDNYDDALEVLTALQSAYPGHDYAEEAGQIIETLHQRLSFIPQTLGVLLPLSGPYQLYGQRALNGIELALSLLQSGEEAIPIRLVIKDTGAEDNQAIQGVRALFQEGVGAIIGPIVSAPSAAREAQKLNLPMITFTQKSDITATGDFIFRHFITPQSQVRALVSYFINGVGLRDFAVLYPRETYGQTFMSIFLDEVAGQGGRLVGAESYDAQQTDFAESIRKLVGTHYAIPDDLQVQPLVQVERNPYFQNNSSDSSRFEDLLPDPMTRLTGLFFQNPDQDRVRGPAIGRKQEHENHNPIIDFDVLFIPDAPKTAGLILPQLAYHDIKDIYLAGTNLWHSQQLIAMTQKYAQNAVMADGFNINSPAGPVRRFVATYKALYNDEPGIIEAFAFDTAWLMFNALAQPNIDLRHTLRDLLLERFEAAGVTGPTSFDANGEAIKRLSLLRIKGKRFVEIPPQ